MHIDSYQFGEVVIDGVGYNSDVLILADSVQGHWRRVRGHSLAVEDLGSVVEASPSVLVVGCGASGMMSVPRRTRKALLEYNIELEAFDTTKAVERFNELSQTGADVAAALHLTC
ncbi:MAG: Mth938-like domain-containing protein [Planctomycetes bacterium]|nr:Mth938-like domain-containing protein [Planctomycetota bacterium]